MSTRSPQIHSVNLYAIKDVATNSFGVLFEARTDQEASRMCQQHIQTRTDDLMSLYPQDYQLFRMGRYDRASGVLSSDQEYIAPLNQLNQPKKALGTAA